MYTQPGPGDCSLRFYPSLHRCPALVVWVHASATPVQDTLAMRMRKIGKFVQSMFRQTASFLRDCSLQFARC